MRPNVPQKKLKYNPVKDKQKNNYSHCRTQSSFVICNKAGYLKRRHKYHSSDQCNEFDSAKTTRYLYGRLDKRDAASKKFHNTEKKMQKQMKALKKYNNKLFNMSIKTNPRRDLKSINNINKDSYY